MSTPVLSSDVSLHAELRSLADVLQDVLAHLRVDLDDEDEPSEGTLHHHKSRTVRSIREGGERVSDLRTRVEARLAGMAARRQVLEGRLGALDRSRRELESVAASRVVRPAPAVCVVIGVLLGGIVADLALGLSGVDTLAIAGALTFTGGATAYAVHALGAAEGRARWPALALSAALAAFVAWVLGDGLSTSGRLAAVALAALLAGVTFAVVDGLIATEAERRRRRLLTDTTNGISAAVGERDRVIDDEEKRLDGALKHLVELEESHSEQSREQFVASAGLLIGRAPEPARSELEQLRDELLVEIDAAIVESLKQAIRP